MRHVFDKVSLKGRKTVKCGGVGGGCGRRLTRSREFWQTVNPMNRDGSGLPKTRETIRAEIQAERDAWAKQEEYCGTCDAKPPWDEHSTRQGAR